MLKLIENLLYRRNDPSRAWPLDPRRLEADIVRCTFCTVPLGQALTTPLPLGPTQDARAASRGNLTWPHLGAGCFLEEGGGGNKLGDFRLILDPAKNERPFPGKLFADGQPLPWSRTTSEDQITAALGPPFARADNDWDASQMLFYEFPAGELQIALHHDSLTLEMLECWYEPELAQDGALKTYGIDKPFPPEFRRKISS